MLPPTSTPSAGNRKPPPSKQVLRKRMILFFLQVLSFLLLGTIFIFSAILIFRAFNGDASTATPPTENTTASTTVPSAETTEPIVTTEATTTTPPPVAPQEFLPDSPKAEAFFGPLPIAETPEPVRTFPVRGMYLGSGASLSKKIETFKDSDINAYVIDLKETDGIRFDSKNELANEMGFVKPAYNLKNLVETAHNADVKIIARIVCFNDPELAKNYPDRAICDAAGNPLKYKNEHSNAFANPYDIRNWDYLIDLALEAVEAGVDEIQFDYVRFPTGPTVSGEKPYFGDPETIPSRIEVINRFLQTARIKIQDEYGVPVTADVFGIIITGPKDGENLGQGWDSVGLTGVSAVAPMIYPSHYALNTVLNGVSFDKPDFHPHDVIYNALMAGKPVANQENYCVVRPYLQAFTASYMKDGTWKEYKYAEINAQIKAVYDAGYEEWILWNSGASYPAGKYDGK